jgi:uncharacterized protein YndB with AHSA1/START domain
MKWILIVLGALVAIGAVAYLVGLALPVSHVAARRKALPAPPEVVWKHMTDVDAFPAWRRDVTRAERLPDRDGRTTWVEEGERRMTFVLERSEPHRLLVSRIADRDLPFGGTWTYELAPAAGGTALTITEHGEIYNPIFRLMARYVFGYEATMTSYLDALEARLR